MSLFDGHSLTKYHREGGGLAGGGEFDCTMTLITSMNALIILNTCMSINVQLETRRWGEVVILGIVVVDQSILYIANFYWKLKTYPQ